ncbi:hypothetical protein EDB86DRAFT_3087319 [Lactarius hatsudake]|nr:hypothetical protein EDB86DRAFT_3087319 [Lactarius hatsudake]
MPGDTHHDKSRSRISGRSRIHLSTEHASAYRYVVYGLNVVSFSLVDRVASRPRPLPHRLTTAQAQIPGLADCPHATPRPILPFMMPLCVFGATDPSMDAWRQISTFAQTGEHRREKVEYEVLGGERVR